MSTGQQINWADEAKKYGGQVVSAKPQTDWAAEAAKFGGKPVASTPTPEQPGAARRYGSGLLEMVNPLPAIKGAFTDPAGTAVAPFRAQYDTLKKGYQAAKEGRVSEAVGYGAAGLMPLVGPAAASVGETIGSGDVARGMGQATGLVGGMLLGPRAANKGRTAIAESVPKIPAVAKGAVKLTRPFTSPKTIRREWAADAMKVLEEAKDQSLATAKNKYVQIEATAKAKPTIDSTSVAAVLPEESPFSGIKAARAKLGDGDSLNAVRDARSEIWTYLRRERSLPPDEYKAYKAAYGQLSDELKGAYARVGKLDEFLDAEKTFRVHMDTFHGNGSPISRALEAKRPATGDIESKQVISNLGVSDVAESQLTRLQKAGVPSAMRAEAHRIDWARKMGEGTLMASPFSLFSKVPLMKEALGYIATRPLFYRSLRQKAVETLKAAPKKK